MVSNKLTMLQTSRAMVPNKWCPSSNQRSHCLKQVKFCFKPAESWSQTSGVLVLNQQRPGFEPVKTCLLKTTPMTRFSPNQKTRGPVTKSSSQSLLLQLITFNPDITTLPMLPIIKGPSRLRWFRPKLCQYDLYVKLTDFSMSISYHVYQMAAPPTHLRLQRH